MSRYAETYSTPDGWSGGLNNFGPAGHQHRLTAVVSGIEELSVVLAAFLEGRQP